MIYKIGQKTVKGYVSSAPLLSADDPIYTRGFTIGGWITKDSFPATAETALPTPNVLSQTPGSSKKKPAAKRTSRTSGGRSIGKRTKLT